VADERLGLTTAGQRTVESTGGASERHEALRHVRDLVLRRFAEVVFLAVYVPALVGPWVLAVYVPWAFDATMHALGRWLWGEESGVNRASLLALGVAVALALAVTPDELLLWWPFRWQTHHADWLGLRMHPLLLLLRGVLLVAPIAARREVWYLDQRQRIEIIAPTLSGVAYTSPEAHRVAIPGVWNPHRAEAETPNPEPPRDELRRVMLRNRGREVELYGDGPAVAVGNGAGDGTMLELDAATTAELVAFPLKLFGRGDQGALNARTWAARVLADESLYSGRAAVKDKLITDWSSRKLFDWMQAGGYADPPDAMHRRALTGRGRRLLRAVARGDVEAF
jgi:hypothetical protein